MATGSFSTKVAAFTKKYQAQTRVVLKESVQQVVSEAQKVGPSKNGIGTDEGGAMRVHTGFLRASINAAVNQMPQGVSVNPDPKTEGSSTYQGDGVTATIIRWDVAREVLFVGWTANYARAREYQDGFLRTAVEKWDGIVKQSAIKAKTL